MTKLKSYNKHQSAIVPKKQKPKPSGIACDEKGCKGEMMIRQPEVNHPELPLKRASCGKCGWRGWV